MENLIFTVKPGSKLPPHLACIRTEHFNFPALALEPPLSPQTYCHEATRAILLKWKTEFRPFCCKPSSEFII